MKMVEEVKFITIRINLVVWIICSKFSVLENVRKCIQEFLSFRVDLNMDVSIFLHLIEHLTIFDFGDFQDLDCLVLTYHLIPVDIR